MKRVLDTLEEEDVGYQLFGQTPVPLDILKCIAVWCVEECIFTFGSFCLVSKCFNEAVRNPVSPYVYFSYSPQAEVVEWGLPLSLPGITRAFHPFPSVLSSESSRHVDKKTKRMTTTNERSKDFKNKDSTCNHRNNLHPSFYEQVTGCWQVACKFTSSANICSAYTAERHNNATLKLNNLYCSTACQCVHEVLDWPLYANDPQERGRLSWSEVLCHKKSPFLWNADVGRAQHFPNGKAFDHGPCNYGDYVNRLYGMDVNEAPKPLGNYCPCQSDHIDKKQTIECNLRRDERHQRILYTESDLKDVGLSYGIDLEKHLFASSSSSFWKTRREDLDGAKYKLRYSLASHQKKLWNLPETPSLRGTTFKTEKGADLWSLACYHYYMELCGMNFEHPYTEWFFDTFLPKDYMQFEKDERKYKNFLKTQRLDGGDVRKYPHTLEESKGYCICKHCENMQVVCAVVRLLLVLNRSFTLKPRREDTQPDKYRAYYRERREQLWYIIESEEKMFGPRVFWHVACNARFSKLLKETLCELAHVRASAEWTIHVWTRILLAFRDDNNNNNNNKYNSLLRDFFGDTSAHYVETTLTSLSQWKYKEEDARYVHDVNEIPFVKKYYDMLGLWIKFHWTAENEGEPIYRYLYVASRNPKIYKYLFVDILSIAAKDETKYTIDWLRIIANTLGKTSRDDTRYLDEPRGRYHDEDGRLYNLFSIIRVMESDRRGTIDSMSRYYNGEWTLYGRKRISNYCEYIKTRVKPEKGKGMKKYRIQLIKALIDLGFRWKYPFVNDSAKEEEEEERIVIDLT